MKTEIAEALRSLTQKATVLPRFAILTILAAQVASLSAQTLSNGDFELPGFGASTVGGPGNADEVSFPSTTDTANQTSRGYTVWWCGLPPGSRFIPGWTVDGSGIYYIGPAIPVAYIPKYPAASSGSYYLELDYNAGNLHYVGGSIAQDITDLKFGTNYFLFFDLWQPSLGPSSIVTVQIGAKSWPVLNSTYGTWQTTTIPFVATSGTMTLKFSTPNAAVGEILLDNVRVSAVSNAPVALSATLTTGIMVTGNQGNSYRVEYSDSIQPPEWSLLSRVTVTNSPTWVYDPISPQTNRRIYRSVQE